MNITTTTKPPLHLFISILLLLFVFISSTDATWDLPQDEINSLLWLRYRFGINWNTSIPIETQNNVLFENGHLTAVILSASASVYPDPGLVGPLIFSQIQTISIKSEPYIGSISDIFDRMSVTPTLNSLYVTSTTATTVYDGFATIFPNLETATFSLPNLESMTESLITHPKLNYLALSMTRLTSMPYMTKQSNLVSLNLGFGISDSLMTFAETSYPKLNTLTVVVGNSPKFQLRVQSTAISSFFYSSNALLNRVDIMTPNTKKLIYSCLPGSTTEFLTTYLELYSRLEVLYLYDIHGYDSFPFNLPSHKLVELNIKSSSFATINLGMVSSQYIGISENVNLTTIQNFPPPGVSSLAVQENPILSGNMSDNLCQVTTFTFRGTPGVYFPTCYQCYANIPGSNQVSETIAAPVCPPSPAVFANNSYPSIDFGKTVTIVGDFLGWASPAADAPGLTAIVPNNKLVYTMPAGGGQPTTVTLQLSKAKSYVKPLYWFDASLRINTIAIAQQPTNILLLVNVTTGSIPVSAYYFNQNQVCDVVTVVQGIAECRIQSSRLPSPIGNIDFLVENEYTSSNSSVVYTQLWPIIRQSNSINTLGGTVILYGTFEPNIQNTTITINDQSCTIINATTSAVACLLGAPTTSGLATVKMSQYSFNFTSSRILYIQQTSQDLKSLCEKQTSNCNNRGTCNDNGDCQCNSGFYGTSCESIIYNGTVFVGDPSNPTITFEGASSEFKFNFSMISIQEIDVSSNITAELITNSWISTVINETSTRGTIINYILNTTSTVGGTTKNVTATVEFTELSKDYVFGGIQTTIPPNSIKISVNITGWQYQSSINTIRVLFETDYDPTQQQSECGGGGSDDSSVIINKLDNIQYLRVIKSGVVFLGRFLDYAVADGRSAFSITELVNTTTSTTGQQTKIVVGLNFPHCEMECNLDPWFSPLITDTDICADQDKKTTWKIITIAVVCGVCGVALVFGIFFAFRKKIMVCILDQKEGLPRAMYPCATSTSSSTSTTSTSTTSTTATSIETTVEIKNFKLLQLINNINDKARGQNSNVPTPIATIRNSFPTLNSQQHQEKRNNICTYLYENFSQFNLTLERRKNIEKKFSPRSPSPPQSPHKKLAVPNTTTNNQNVTSLDFAWDEYQKEDYYYYVWVDKDQVLLAQEQNNRNGNRVGRVDQVQQKIIEENRKRDRVVERAIALEKEKKRKAEVEGEDQREEERERERIEREKEREKEESGDIYKEMEDSAFFSFLVRDLYASLQGTPRTTDFFDMKGYFIVIKDIKIYFVDRKKIDPTILSMIKGLEIDLYTCNNNNNNNNNNMTPIQYSKQQFLETALSHSRNQICNNNRQLYLNLYHHFQPILENEENPLSYSLVEVLYSVLFSMSFPHMITKVPHQIGHDILACAYIL
ncbi:hypothetical protein DFA_05306 [Cavenderia fasciculata]|uniref:EGF-like domain-containing protein n=1 Tax=Cavenderia fasciculata TaxID=261658 RepID=F4PNX1_CACFS|nr:uncharacterized protein DFA_05306 [Cavenderia fasciculata]EGG23174.1 hypothetical protein DFA_05306 [Cavenderia fasciculata]|eukprot:XP_004361025.1 hypothetical protein DFA_05306 [Cavenderia fasciculata]